MTHAHTIRRLAALALASVFVLAPALAHAKQRSSSLGPAVRHKLELRKGRFELAPTFEMSVAADYKNLYSAGLKAEYHLTDSLSIGAMGFFGASLDSGLTSQIAESLSENSTVGDPTPSRSQFKSHLNEMPVHGAVHVTLTPWFGKMSLFGKGFLNFDVYVRGGVGFAQMKNSYDQGPDEAVSDGVDEQGMPTFTDPRNDGPQNSGLKPGALVGGGMHVYLNRWMAIDFSFHDYIFSDNPSGLDFTGDLAVTGDDSRILNHLFFGIGLAMYLPPKAKISP